MATAPGTQRRARFARLVLAVSMLVMGACGIIYEYTLGVLGNNLMGSSHEQLFVIIGLMLFAMGLGAMLQQQLVDGLIDRFLWIELLLGLLGGTSTIVIYTSFVFTDSYQLIMYAFALSIGVLIGCEIPLLIRINTEYTDSLRGNLSTILSMDYVGSLAGALLFTYVLLTRVSVERISLLLGCVNTLLAIGGLIYFWPVVGRRRLLAVSCAGVLVGLAVALSQSASWMAQLEQRCFEDPIIYSETSRYQHVVLTQSHAKDRTRLYIDGNLQFSSEDESIYHEMLVHVPMTLAASREHVLILGGGDGLALREVLKYPDVDEVTLVDIDPAVIRMASSQPDLLEINQAAFHDARVHVAVPDGIQPTEETTTIQCRTHRHPLVDQTHYDLAEVTVFTVDADLFVRDVDEAYDVILVDFPDPRSVELAKLYSVEFYRSLSRRLKPGGMCSIQSTNPFRGRAVFRCIGRTLQTAGLQSLPYHDHVPSFGEWSWHLAWTGDLTSDEMRTRISRMRELEVETSYLTPEAVSAAFVFGLSDEPDEPILASSRMRPVVMHYYAESLARNRSY